MTAPRVFVLAGDPVAQSKSPAMHTAAFRALGLPHTYEAMRVDGTAFRSLLLALRRGQIAGMNVTVPHKRIALALADLRDPVAEAAGAANTLALDGAGRVVAFNTDVPALEAELDAMGARATKHALVLGSGGAARAAVLALAGLRVSRITIRARDVERARALVTLVRDVEIAVEPLAPAPATDATLSVIIQATSAGMTGADAGDAIAAAVAWDVVPEGALAYDVVYAPPLTPFLAAARARGLRAENGLGMLVRQGGLALTHWLGVPAPLAEMRAALAEATGDAPTGV